MRRRVERDLAQDGGEELAEGQIFNFEGTLGDEGANRAEVVGAGIGFVEHVDVPVLQDGGSGSRSESGHDW